MPYLDRRSFIKMLGAGAIAGSFPALTACSKGKTEDLYSIPQHGNVRILHCTDFHGQLMPVYFREPNVNLGVGDA
jgi:sulfur-oxidizing protein SoxB